MKKFTSFFILVISNFANSQTYPASFAWPVTGAKNQQIQGPCTIFASTAATESWTKILYNQDINLAEEHLYSPCGGANGGNSTDIPIALSFLQNTGVVETSCIPYTSGTDCTTPVFYPGITYFAVKFGNSTTTPAVPGPQIPYNLLYNNECGTPWCNCTVGNYPSARYKIGNFQSLNIAGMLSSNDLKRAIMNSGPIAIRMDVLDPNYPELHTGQNHAYLLYGWGSDGKWWLKDSWPGLQTTKNATAFDIVNFFKTGGNGNAYVIKNGASNPGVYKESYNSNTHVWSYSSPTPGCWDTSGSTAFAINSPTTIPAAGATVSVTNMNLLDNGTIQWSFQPTAYNATVAFSPNPSSGGASVTATGAVSGTGTIVAQIKRPNGLCETIRKYNITVVGPNIPFNYTKTTDVCVGTTRKIVYQVTSPYSISCSWDFRPAPGASVTTSISGCTFTMNYTSYPSGYGLIVSVTSPSFPGRTDQGTAGGTAQSCSGHIAARQPDVSESVMNTISIYPNPAEKILNVVLPTNQLYKVTLISITGANLLTVVSGKAIVLDVGKYSRGVYMLHIINLKNSGEPVIKKVVLQ